MLCTTVHYPQIIFTFAFCLLHSKSCFIIIGNFIFNNKHFSYLRFYYWLRSKILIHLKCAVCAVCAVSHSVAYVQCSEGVWISLHFVMLIEALCIWMRLTCIFTVENSKGKTIVCLGSQLSVTRNRHWHITHTAYIFV